MADSFIQLPPDGAGKEYLARTIPYNGSGEPNIYVGVSVSQPDNGVGHEVHFEQWASVPGTVTELSAVPCAVDVLWFNNWSVSPATIYVDDGAGNTIWEYTLAAGQFFPLILNGMPAAGLRWQCTAGSLNGAARWFTAS
jgi:hypothetical protein